MDTIYAPDTAWRAARKPLITPRGWTQVTHHLLGLPLGTAYFVWIVTGLSLGAGVAITLLGTVLEGLALVPLGAVLLVAAGWISEGMAAMSRALAGWGVR